MSGRGWGNVDHPELLVIMERVCTPKQIECLKLKSTGHGAKRSALILGCDESTVRGHLRAAERRIREEVAAQRGIVS
jgi:DNA-binding CsgD family transcriptional regulator